MNYGRDDWKNIRNNPHMFDEKEKYSRNEESSYKKKYHSNAVGSMNHLMPGSKKESLPPNKFSYSFQPAAMPHLPPKVSSKSNAGLGGLGYVPLPSKGNSLLKKEPLQGLHPYKF